jgi:hypothetical protein
MINPRPIATLLIALFFSGCACCAAFDRVKAGPIASAEPPDAAAQPPTEPHGRVYLFRGFGGLVFARGMDQLAERIERAGITTNVNEAVMCHAIAEQAIREYHEKAVPITAIGHSVGAACALGFAEMLDAEKVPVSLLVTTDPARIAQDVPPNVERYINIFQSNSILGGGDVVPAQGFQGHYASFDLAEHKEITHLNIEKAEFIHEQLVSKIVQLAATPAKSDSEAVPIRYVVPADATIELWDSGMPVFAQPGDTLQTLATLYHVPLWSLTQMNRVSDAAVLAPGQRVIVPRHLLPLAASANGTVSGQPSAKP